MILCIHLAASPYFCPFAAELPRVAVYTHWVPFLPSHSLSNTLVGLCSCLTTQPAIVVVQLLSHVRLFATPWTAARQASLSLTISQSLLKLTPTESVMLTISSSATFFSFCLQSFPASESFPMSQLFPSGGQSIGASASVPPVDIQG